MSDDEKTIVENDLNALEHFASHFWRQSEWARSEGWEHTEEALKHASEIMRKALDRVRQDMGGEG